MPPVGSPDESAEWVRALLEDAGLARVDDAAGGASTPAAVDARDEMLEFLASSLDGDRERALYAYFQSGLAIAGAMLQLLRWRFGEPARVGRLLDFASGYGRVTRFLLAEVPAERVWVSDVYEEGVRFQQERFGVHGIVSAVAPEDFAAAGRFDAILVTSLFTHLPEERFVGWLARLLGLLAPGGLLGFSVHGEELLAPGVELPATGILFQEISESGSLAASDYGSTWVSEGFVRGALLRAAEAARQAAPAPAAAAVPAGNPVPFLAGNPVPFLAGNAAPVPAGNAAPAPSLHRLPRALCNFQDLYVVVPEPDADFSRLGFRYEPSVFVERCALAGGRRLALSGWGCVPGGGRLCAVEAVLDGQLLATLAVGDPRPDVAALMGGERFLLSGWGGSCPLPPGASPLSVLRLRALDDQGRRFPLQASRLASALLDSTRLEVTVVERHLAQARSDAVRAAQEAAALRARIAAMEASRFWKLRNRWFQFKRALGWTDEP
jgi:SAM-dependent methyltransferase